MASINEKEWQLIIWRLGLCNQKSQSGSSTESFAFGVVVKERAIPLLRVAPGGSGWLRVTPPLVGASSTPPGAPAVFRSIENPLFSFPSQHSKTKVYFKWPVPGRRLSTWIQVFPLSQPSLHLHVLTPPAASLVSCAIFFSSLGSSRLFACCVF